MALAACILMLAGCGLDMLEGAGGGGRRRPSRPGKPGDIGNAVITDTMKPVDFRDLRGWADDDHRYALQAFRNTCAGRIQFTGTVIPDERLTREKCQIMPPENAGRATVRDWFETHFQPFKVWDDKTLDGKFTGYFSPVRHACRTQTERCSVPIMDRPRDGREFKGVHSRIIVEQRIGEVLFWIDPIDLQDMGSATLILEDGERVRLSVASTNDLPFNGIGSQLLARGIRPPGGFGMRSVREFLKLPENRALAQELVDNNPRYVFYTRSRTEAVYGRMGVPLSRIRSIAIDENIYTLGLPVFIDTTLSANGRPFQRLMIAQDTGGAILGKNRVDIYFGVGEEAFEYAHGQNTKGQMYFFMPIEARR